MALVTASPITLALTTPRTMRGGELSVWTVRCMDLPPGQFRLRARSRLFAAPIEAKLNHECSVPLEIRMKREAGEGVVEFSLESSATNGQRAHWLGHTPFSLAPMRGRQAIEIAPTVTVGEGGMALDPTLAVHLPHSHSHSHLRIAPRLNLGEWGVLDRPSLQVHFEEGGDGRDGQTRTITLRPTGGVQGEERWRPEGASDDLPRQERMPDCLRVNGPLRVWLRCSNNPNSVHSLLLGDRLTIGRDPACGICLAPGPPEGGTDLHRLSHLSAAAAEIRLTGSGTQVRNLNRNGATLGDAPLGEAWQRLSADHTLRFPAPGTPFEVALEVIGEEAVRVTTGEGRSHLLWRGELDLESALEDHGSIGPPLALAHREGHLWLRPHCDEVTVRHPRGMHRVGHDRMVALPRDWSAEGDGWWVKSNLGK